MCFNMIQWGSSWWNSWSSIVIIPQSIGIQLLSDFIMERIVFLIYYVSQTDIQLLEVSWLKIGHCSHGAKLPIAYQTHATKWLTRTSEEWWTWWNSARGLVYSWYAISRPRPGRKKKCRKEKTLLWFQSVNWVNWPSCQLPASTVSSWKMLEQHGTRCCNKPQRSFIIFSDWSQWISASWGFQSEWEMLLTLDAGCIRAKAKAHRAKAIHKNHIIFTPHSHHMVISWSFHSQLLPKHWICSTKSFMRPRAWPSD